MDDEVFMAYLRKVEKPEDEEVFQMYLDNKERVKALDSYKRFELIYKIKKDLRNQKPRFWVGIAAFAIIAMTLMISALYYFKLV